MEAEILEDALRIAGKKKVSLRAKSSRKDGGQ